MGPAAEEKAFDLKDLESPGNRISLCLRERECSFRGGMASPAGGLVGVGGQKGGGQGGSRESF